MVSFTWLISRLSKTQTNNLQLIEQRLSPCSAHSSVNSIHLSRPVLLLISLLGDVRNTSEFRDAIGTHIEITFNTHDAAKCVTIFEYCFNADGLFNIGKHCACPAIPLVAAPCDFRFP